MAFSNPVIQNAGANEQQQKQILTRDAIRYTTLAEKLDPDSRPAAPTPEQQPATQPAPVPTKPQTVLGAELRRLAAEYGVSDTDLARELGIMSEEQQAAQQRLARAREAVLRTQAENQRRADKLAQRPAALAAYKDAANECGELVEQLTATGAAYLAIAGVLNSAMSRCQRACSQLQGTYDYEEPGKPEWERPLAWSEKHAISLRQLERAEPPDVGGAVDPWKVEG